MEPGHPRHHRDLHRIAGGEDGLQAEVVPLRDGIELVVVTAGAGQSQPHEDRARGVDPVGHSLVRQLGGVEQGFDDLGTEGIETGADTGLQVLQLLRGNAVVVVVEFQIVGPQLIPGDLLLQEPVVGFVLVQGLDDVVAITPGVGEVLVGLVAAAVGVAHQVQPVSGPALTVAGRGQQVADENVVGVGRGVLQKTVHLFGRGRQAGQIESGSADQGPAVRLGCRLQSVALQLLQDERIDGISDPTLVLDRGNRGESGPSERPPSRFGRTGSGGRRVPGSASVDPVP